MAKKLLTAAVLLLAIHFVAVAAAVGWLFAGGHVDGEKLAEMRKIAFPDPTPTTRPTTAPADPAATQPILRLDQLLARQPGQGTAEQVEFIRQSFDAQSAQLERQRRELIDLRRQLDAAQQEVVRRRAEVDQRERAFADREAKARTAAEEKGFQESLAVYDALPVGQVKELFMSLPETTAVRYLQAMEPRRAAKVLKEFSTPDELARAQSLLERVRKNDPDASPEAKPASPDPGP